MHTQGSPHSGECELRGLHTQGSAYSDECTLRGVI
ncbi:hypothetical protein CP02DC22_1154, partial [Chlamydia psittaci 02DC22]